MTIYIFERVGIHFTVSTNCASSSCLLLFNLLALFDSDFVFPIFKYLLNPFDVPLQDLVFILELVHSELRMLTVLLFNVQLRPCLRLGGFQVSLNQLCIQIMNLLCLLCGFNWLHHWFVGRLVVNTIVCVLCDRYRRVKCAQPTINAHCQIQGCFSLADLVSLDSFGQLVLLCIRLSLLHDWVIQALVDSLLCFDHLLKLLDFVNALLMVLFLELAWRVCTLAILSHVYPVLTARLSVCCGWWHLSKHIVLVHFRRVVITFGGVPRGLVNHVVVTLIVLVVQRNLLDREVVLLLNDGVVLGLAHVSVVLPSLSRRDASLIIDGCLGHRMKVLNWVTQSLRSARFVGVARLGSSQHIWANCIRHEWVPSLLWENSSVGCNFQLAFSSFSCDSFWLKEEAFLLWWYTHEFKLCALLNIEWVFTVGVALRIVFLDLLERSAYVLHCHSLERITLAQKVNFCLSVQVADDLLIYWSISSLWPLSHVSDRHRTVIHRKITVPRISRVLDIIALLNLRRRWLVPMSFFLERCIEVYLFRPRLLCAEETSERGTVLVLRGLYRFQVFLESLFRVSQKFDHILVWLLIVRLDSMRGHQRRAHTVNMHLWWVIVSRVLRLKQKLMCLRPINNSIFSRGKLIKHLFVLHFFDHPLGNVWLLLRRIVDGNVLVSGRH